MIKVKLSNLKSKLAALNDDDQLFVGLDVHKKTYSAAFIVNEEVIATCVMPASAALVVEILQHAAANLKMVVYEAGPTGFGLARALASAQMPVMVVSASQLPRSAKRGSKSDRLDCCNLAELVASGLPLATVLVPTAEQEADRQLIRQRERIKHKRRKVMQQIKSFMLQHSLPEPDNCWTLAGQRYLRQLELLPPLRYCLDCLMAELEFYCNKLKLLDAELVQLAVSEPYRELVQITRSHPGVGVTLSIYLLTELFAITGAVSKRELVSYCGLAPMIRQSGERTKGGPLIKSGKSSVRAMLVQCAWVWIRHDEVGRKIYSSYLRNSGCAQKAIIATARRMLINLWSMLRNGRFYQAEKVCKAA